MGKNVLVVDDAAFIRMMVRDILTRNSYAVVGEAANGKQAVERYRELRPDLTLLDAAMPEMDGFQALQIRSYDPDTRIIMACESGKVLKCARAGADGIVCKPFQAEQLMDTVKTVCG